MEEQENLNTMDTNLYDSKGEEKGKIDLPVIFSQKVNTALLYEVVSAYLSNQRKGCASTKTRGEISGGGRKPWRQKGTGRARAGSIRSPLWRHGGVVFGPKPRDYSVKLPRKKIRKALGQALSAKAGLVKVIENLEFKEVKTKSAVGILKNWVWLTKKHCWWLKKSTKILYVFCGIYLICIW